MAIPYEKVVEEDLNLGRGTVLVSMPGGGSVTGHQIGPHTFAPAIFDVTEYGAVGDGIADDTVAIQAAITAALLAGGSVYLPATTKYYRCRSGLLVSFTSAGQTFRLFGDGLQSYLFFQNSTSTPQDGITIDATLAKGANGKAVVSMADVTIGTDTTFRYAMNLKSSHRGTYKNVWITGAGNAGLLFGGCFLNTFLGGGVSLNVGSPGGVLQATPLYGVVLGAGPDNGGSNGNSFIGSCFEGCAEVAKAITGATNATPIQITSAGHGYVAGDIVAIAGVTGNTAANGSWSIGTITANTFTLTGSAGNGAYVNGGTSTRGAGILVTGTSSSYGNLFAGGTSENNATGAFIDTNGITNAFINIDISGNTIDFQDRSTALITTVIQAIAGGDARFGGRLMVASADQSTFFPVGGAQLGLIRASGVPTIFSSHIDSDLVLIAKGIGVLRLKANGVGDGTGGSDVLTLSLSGGTPIAHAPGNLGVGTALSGASDVVWTGSAKTAWTPGVFASGAAVTKTFAVTGVALGDVAVVSYDVALGAGFLSWAEVASAGNVDVTLFNITGAPSNIGALNVRVACWRHA